MSLLRVSEISELFINDMSAYDRSGQSLKTINDVVIVDI